MAECEISIEFDRSDRKYRGGESISGSVHVVAKQDLTYDSITLIGAWHCHGYGLPVTRDVCGSLLDSAARLKAGERRSFPFSIEAPSEPLTYHGVELNIDQHVRVELCFPTGPVQEFTEQYHLAPGVPPGSLKAEVNEPGRTDSDAGARQGWAVAVVVAICSAAGFLWFPIVGYVGFGILALNVVHSLVFAAQLRSVVVTASNTVVGAGGDYVVTVTCKPRMNLTLQGIRVTLRCLEASMDYDLSDDDHSAPTPSSISQEVHKSEKVYCKGAVLKAGQPFTTEVSGTVPQTEAYSFATGCGDVREERVCSVRWELRVSVLTRLFAGRTCTLPIRVVPPEFLEQVAKV